MTIALLGWIMRLLALSLLAASLAVSVAAAPKKGKKKPADANTDNPAYQTVTVQLTPMPGDQPAPPAGFIHPGVLVNRAQLEEIHRRYQAGIQPQKGAVDALKASPYGALVYQSKPRFQVECGPYSTPDLGCKDEQRDAAAAYGQALLWAATGDDRYAKNAIAIMNAWSATLHQGHTNANGPVQAAWTGELWPRAAEIIRYTTHLWPPAEIARFQNLLRTQYLSSLIHGSTENGNKELAQAEALINIGVFLDDRAVYDLGVKLWRGRAPAYIYLTTDGPKPIEPVGAGTAIWSNKGEMPKLVDGLLQETARDSQHANLAFSAMCNAAETARQQGLDLYGEQARRMMAAMEFQAQYLPPNHGVPPENLEFNLHPTWEIPYNEFHGRLGYALPKMGAVVAAHRPTDVNHMMAWETLTHGEMGSIGLPPVESK